MSANLDLWLGVAMRTLWNKWLMIGLMVLLFVLIGTYSVMLGAENMPPLHTGGYYELGR